MILSPIRQDSQTPPPHQDERRSADRVLDLIWDEGRDVLRHTELENLGVTHRLLKFGNPWKSDSS